MPRITEKLIREMSAPATGRPLIIRDDRVRGFGVRKTATGFTAFIFNYVINGRERRMTIGDHPAWSIEAARVEAARLRVMVDGGNDPLEQREKARAVLTVAELWDRYRVEVSGTKRPSTQRNEQSMWLRLILPRIGNRRINDVRPGDIDALHQAVSISTPTQANRLIASLRHVFNRAIRWELITANPVTGTRANSEEPRQRYLSTQERARLVAALDRRDTTSSVLALRFLLLTGARRGEVLGATWDQFDLDEGVWTKPSSHTKQKRVHRVPLSPGAVEVLRQARQITNSEFAFPGRTGLPLVEIKKLFSAVCEEAEIRDLRIHDLRHSYASVLASGGVSLPIIGALLGHSQVSTTARYSHLADDALRVATNMVSDQIG